MFDIPTPDEIASELHDDIYDLVIDSGDSSKLLLCAAIQEMIVRITGCYAVALTKDIPVESKHGMFEGRTFWAWNERGLTGDEVVWVKSDQGMLVSLLKEDYEVVK